MASTLAHWIPQKNLKDMAWLNMTMDRNYMRSSKTEKLMEKG